MKKIILLLTYIFTVFFASAQSDTLYLWPGDVPGETSPKADATMNPNRSRNVSRLGDVTNPLLVHYKPKLPRADGASIVLAPGGGYHILAIDLEGYEVAEWLNTQGISVFVLQYRVPQKRLGALQDMQRAVRYVRAHAGKFGVSADMVGVMGFSAGGSLSARASTLYEEAAYPQVDDIDTLSVRPDYSVLIYPAYLDEGENRTITPEIKTGLTENTPPMFIFATADDNHGNSALVMTGALRDAEVPVELHLYPEGGHGYGLRPGNPAADVWPRLLAEWLNTTLPMLGE